MARYCEGKIQFIGKSCLILFRKKQLKIVIKMMSLNLTNNLLKIKDPSNSITG